MSGILFVPEWQTAYFWIEIFKQNQALKWPFTQFTKHVPFIVQKEHNHKSPFAGRVKFNFLAIKFETHWCQLIYRKIIKDPKINKKYNYNFMYSIRLLTGKQIIGKKLTV